MSVTLSRAYSTYASGAVVTLPDATESALIAQGLAVQAGVTSYATGFPGMISNVTQGGNQAPFVESGNDFTYYQGPLILPCIPLGSAALTTYNTNGVACVAGTIQVTEIYVPYYNKWTGIGILNGTTVGTHNVLVCLFGSNGALLANSAVAGVVSASASVFQNVAFTTPITLAPGRYFLGSQFSGTTPTPRKLKAIWGANVCTGSQTGVFGTIPSALTTIPTTFTDAQGIISQLYT